MKVRLLHIVLFLTLSGSWVCGAANASPRIDVVFRFDDYSSGMATDQVVRIFMLFEKRAIPITFAVIPFGGSFKRGPGQPEPQPLTEEKAWILKRMLSTGKFEVAQHGFSHEEANKGQSQSSSEFCDRPFDEQVQRITLGKKLLEERLGIRIMSFSPPWNTYNEDTLRALKQCGFRVFSPGGPDDALQAKYKMPVIGCGAGVGTVKARVEEARKQKGRRVLVTALFHIYEIKDFNPNGTFTLKELAETLDWLKAQPGVDFYTLQGAAKKIRP